jgi:uncharacterized membrane protein
MSTALRKQELTQALRERRRAASAHRHPVNQKHFDDRDFGQRIADRLAAGMGSWTFLIVQTALMVIWITLNAVAVIFGRWDVYPFILLNLMLSLQATYAGPIVLLAGNRQSAKDRLTLEHAAVEAEKGGEAVDRILTEIRKNTDLTLEILKDLEGKA